MEKIDLWKLHDELSVVEAALLSCGFDPSAITFPDGDPISSRMVEDHPFGEGKHYEPIEFRSIFGALRRAIIGNKLRATLTYTAHTPDSVASFAEGEFIGNSDLPPNEDEVTFNKESVLNIRVAGGALTSGGIVLDEIGTIYIGKDPNWSESVINIVDLKRFYGDRSFKPPFFFGDAPVDEFSDKSNPRYSPKLACAVAAWKTVMAAKRGLSVKATVEEWVRCNGAKFGMGGDEGVLAKLAVEQVAGVVNWNPGGGANPTGGGELKTPQTEEPVANFPSFDDEIDLPF